jgi:uncharacterized protein (TIGR00251 family)
MEAYMRVDSNCVFLDIKVTPNASKSRFAGISGDRLKIAIAAAPEDGKANAELRAFLAKALGCPKKDITLISGEKSRLKTMALPLSVLEQCKAAAAQFIKNTPS